MANSDYIPRAEQLFHLWQSNLILGIKAGATAWLLPSTAVTEIEGSQLVWTEAYDKASNVHLRSKSDVYVKNEAKEKYIKDIRAFVGQYLAHNDRLTSADLNELGLKGRSHRRIASPVPTSYPIGKIDLSILLRHKIRITDSEKRGKGKPDGAYGCEIWVSYKESKSPSDYKYLGVSTNGTYIIDFNMEDRGLQVFYLFRWINRRGQHGPWSAPVSSLVV
jgi:hypothetical protein